MARVRARLGKVMIRAGVRARTRLRQLRLRLEFGPSWW